MESLDEWIAGAADGGSLAVVLLVACRSARSTNRTTSPGLGADRRRPPAWRRPRGGAQLACGAGNSATLFAFGMPVVLFADARRHWLSPAARAELRRTAVAAGVRRRFAPPQLRDAHALEGSRSVLQIVIQR